jgi:hypothetical protein
LELTEIILEGTNQKFFQKHYDPIVEFITHPFFKKYLPQVTHECHLTCKIEELIESLIKNGIKKYTYTTQDYLNTYTKTLGMPNDCYSLNENLKLQVYDCENRVAARKTKWELGK